MYTDMAQVRMRETSLNLFPLDRGSVPRQRRRVLVADDSADTALTLATLLRMAGHEVTWACDGYSALTEFDDFVADVGILDISMPGLSGYEVAQAIRKSDLERRVLLIALSGWARASDIRRSLIAGFDHHLIKPADFEIIARLIARL